MKSKLLRAKKQRFSALKLAFKIIDVFAIPSLDPNLYDKYCEVKDYLLKEYK